MAWNAKTFANTLMTVALVRNRGPFSAMTQSFGEAKAHITASAAFSATRNGMGPLSETISSARRSTPLPDR